MMKPALLILSILVALFSCCRESGPKRADLPVERFYNEFADEHSDWLDDESSIRSTNKAFEMALADSIDNEFIEGIPLQMMEIKPYKPNKYVVDFQGWQLPKGFQLKYNLHAIHCDVMAIMTRDQLAQLRCREYYTLEGHFISAVTNIDDFDRYFDVAPVTFMYGFDTDRSQVTDHCLCLGVMLWRITDAKPYSAKVK